MQKKLDKLLIIFLFLNPFLDVITSIQIRNNFNFVSISLLCRGMFFLITLIYLFFNKKKKYVISLGIYLLIEILYIYTFTTNSLLSETFNLIKIFYLPFLLLFFSNYENKYINDKNILIIYLIYLNLIIIPYIFNIGYSMYSPLEDKQGFLGLFYGGNELSAILIGLLPITLKYILEKKKKWLLVLFLIELFITVFVAATKTLFLGVFLVFLIFIINYLFKNYQKLSKKIKYSILSLFILFIPLMILIVPKIPVYNNVKITLNYYQVNSFKDFVSIDTIDKVVFSTRLTSLQKVHEIYVKSSKKEKIFGLGITKFNNIKVIEIDIFDIFYTIGLIGYIVWFIFMFIIIKNSNLNGVYKLSMFLFLLISLFSGHILNKPMVATYISLLPLLNKNKET